MLLFVVGFPFIYPYSRIVFHSHCLSEINPDGINCPKEETLIICCVSMFTSGSFDQSFQCVMFQFVPLFLYFNEILCVTTSVVKTVCVIEFI